jgi:hypothetical protein
MTQKLVVYAFAEIATDDGWRVPGTYLGEFTVETVTGNDITMSTTRPLDRDQEQKIQQGGTWTLYEKMPVDGHELFAEMDDAEGIMVGMDREQLAAFMPNQFGWPQEEYDAFLNQFYRFNREATEDDAPENVWIQVKFLKPHKIQVDSDAEENALESEYYDSRGLAVVGGVRSGIEEGTVEFDIGDMGVFDADTADTLVASGICEKIQPVFRRPLYAFRQFFMQAYHRHLQLDDSIVRVQRDLAELQALLSKAEEQRVLREAEKVKLVDDLRHFKGEQRVASQYVRSLQVEWSKAQARLSALYRSNHQLVQELAKIQAQLTREINQRVRDATAQAPATPPSA